YIRGEYDEPYRMLTEAIEEARAKGYIGPKPMGKDYPLDIRLYRGHGAYICGEETALLESLEGKRAQPRSRPPFPAVKGAWGRPTAARSRSAGPEGPQRRCCPSRCWTSLPTRRRWPRRDPWPGPAV